MIDAEITESDREFMRCLKIKVDEPKKCGVVTMLYAVLLSEAFVGIVGWLLWSHWRIAR